MTELPSTDTDSVKVQFTHKTLQEYLAAFYVVNTPGDEGLQLLMEFCSTSQRLMGSQIILEFISNMSTDILGKAIQNEIKIFVSKWDSYDKVNPRNRTSFLISMLEGNETLKFSLPAVIDINLNTSFKKPALERFFDMDGQGVKKIKLTLGQNNRVNVLQNTSINSLDELHIVLRYSNWPYTSSEEYNKDLCRVMKKMKPGLLCIRNCEWDSIKKTTIDVILQYVHTLILEECGLKQEHLLSMLRAQHHLQVFKVNDKVIRIDGKLMEVVSKLSSDIKLDLNKGLGYNPHGEIILIHKSPIMKSLNLHGIEIDREIAEAVSRLPDDILLDLSGNKLTKMDPRLLPGVVLHMPEDEEINIGGWYITINEDIVNALSNMPQLKYLRVHIIDLH